MTPIMRVILAMLLALLSACNGDVSPLQPTGHLIFIGSSPMGKYPSEAHVFSIDLSRKMSPPVMLTPVDQRVWRLTLQYGPDRFLYQTGVGQQVGEWRQLDVLNPRGSSSKEAVWANTPQFFDELSFSRDGRFVAGTPYMNDRDLRVVDTSGTDDPVNVSLQSAATEISPPAWSPDDSQLVFVGALEGDSNYTELFIVDRVSGRLTQLTNMPNRIPWWKRLFSSRSDQRQRDQHKTIEPRWSPDGQWIAFTSFGGIYKVRPDGSGLQLVAKNALHPAWSPDGRLLCYVAIRKGESQSHIYVSRADGSGEIRITDDHVPMLYSHIYWVN